MTDPARSFAALFGQGARAWVCAAVVAAGGLAVGACAKAQAQSAPAGPPLDVPAPPTRVLAPVDVPAVAAVAPVESPPPAAAPPRPAARPPVRRAEPPPPEPQTPAVVPSEPVPPESRPLRSASSANDAAAEKYVRDALARAARDLGRVDYGKLGADARGQYDQAKRFTQQAEQALRGRNVVFASTLADKAAALAAELAAR